MRQFSGGTALRLVLVGALALGMTGCGSGSASSTPTPTAPAPSPSPSPSPSPTPGATGTALFSTFVNGQSLQWEMIRDVEVDAAGNIYVTGGTTSPAGISLTQGNDYKTQQGAGSLGQYPDTDVLVMKFTAAGKLVWSTRLGGGGYDRAYALEVDANGKVYVAGRAGAGLMTTSGAFQTGFGGDASPIAYGQQDGFVARLNGSSGRMEWTTYVGGNDGGFIRDIDVGPDGTVHVGYCDAAQGRSAALVTSDAMVKSAAADIYLQLSNNGSQLIYGTYLGNGNAGVQSIRVDATGAVNIAFNAAGNVSPAPSTGAFQGSNAGGTDFYLVKLDPATGNRTRKVATWLGGSGAEAVETHHIATDPSGNMFATISFTDSSDLPVKAGSYQAKSGGGQDVFIARMSADGTTLQGSTYFGGSGNDSTEGVVVTDKAVYISGTTTSRNLPVTDTSTFGGYGGGEDGFIAVFSLDLTRLIYATYLGGSGDDQARAIAVDASGNVLVGGQTTSGNFDTKNAQDSKLDGTYGAFLLSLDIGN